MNIQETLNLYHEMMKRMVIDFLETSYDCYLPYYKPCVREFSVTDYSNFACVEFDFYAVSIAPDRPDNFCHLKGSADISLSGQIYINDLAEPEFLDKWPESEVLLNV